MDVALGTSAPSPSAVIVPGDTHAELKPAWCFLAAPVAVGLAVAAIVVAADGGGATVTQAVGAVLVGLWAAAGTALGVRRRHERLGPIVLAGAVVGGMLSLSEALVASAEADGTSNDLAAIGLRMSAAVLPAIAFHVLAALPDGRLTSPARRRSVLVGYAVALVVGFATTNDIDDPHPAALAVLWAAAIVGGLYAGYGRYQRAGAVDRRRMQWVGWGLAVTTEVVLVVIALRLLADWPHSPGTVALASTALVPLGVIAGTAPRMVARVDRLLTHTVAIAGLTALVVAIYVVVVLGLGRTPDGGERNLLLLSMVAAALAALLYVPANTWLNERANRLVYGERIAPDETLRTFGQRLTRSIPLDELLLQLAENLRKSMVLTSAEVWTGTDGTYERTAGVPHRQTPPVTVGPKERPVVARAGVSGGTWLDIWVPQLVGSNGSACMRVAPVAHAGLLLGFIVVTRRPDGEAFTDADDTVLTELARQIALALHNAQLDSALQASLDEVRVRNRELQQSRARIVAAGDSERRKLERNLHDGAQQHLVALAVKLRLAHDSVEDDPEDAMAMIDEIKADVQTAIAELRALAHGIFPPLLVSGGLAEALPAAAGRAALPTTVSLEGVGRYTNDIEAAVYFCTLEALQNAGKHAGDGATATVTVVEASGVLRFEVRDDGAGFDPAGAAGTGHGFVNMSDRLGAFDGRVEVESAPGAGTSIIGTIPLA
jgi:signal transduction histidine kinase